MPQERFSKRTLLGILAPLLLSGMLITQTTPANALDTAYARFNKADELIRPTQYREWIFVGTQVTPKDMNDGKPAFSEFQNVYIDPASWRYWKRTGKFREGTVFVLEMASVGDKKAPSGTGYFQGELGAIAAAVKSKRRFPDKTNNWAYFVFDDKRTAVAQPDDACAACHKANAAEDMVFTQYYPVLRAAKPKPKEKSKRRGIGEGIDLKRGE